MKQSYCVLGVPALLFFSTASFAQVTFNNVPTRIVGQAVIQQRITATAPNLAEGRELYFPQSIALDTSVSPAIVYVADTNNNRVLAWKNAATFTTGSAADLVIGQRDFYSTQAEGPGRDFSFGLFSPTAVAVDSAGNLYVTDAGNNRILRFPKPFTQTPGNIQPDLVIGQTSLNSNNPNQGLNAPTASGLSTNNGGTLQSGLAFDAAGNLWASDPGNNRVLRFPKSVLGTKPGPAADLVLGHAGFTTSEVPSNADAQTKTVLAQPAGLTFDQAGRLYVPDAGNRVLVWFNPTTSGQPADRILGISIPTASNPNPPAISETTLSHPSGVVMVGNNPYVIDTGNNRILGFAPADQWPDEATAFSPSATTVIGQPDFGQGQRNEGGATVNGSTLFSPTDAAYTGTDLLVTDANNNRVLDFPVTGGAVASTATRILGQTGLQYRAINLLEGREVFFNGIDPALGIGINGGAVAVDTKSNPPHLYVSDTGNHRILGFRDARSVTTTTKADIVIGQPDLSSNVINYPFNDPKSPTSNGLFLPQGIAVDSGGNLWVADFGNSRVLRFPTPFDAGHSGASASANLVLGQASLTGPTITGASATSMSGPYGVAVSPSGNVFVSDSILNRVLVFRKSGGDLSSGQSASIVVGQPDFFSSAAQSGVSGLSSPRHLAADAQDRLYVADSGNGRVAIFSGLSSAISNPPPSLSLTGLASPNGVSVLPAGGNIWVANTGANNVLEYPAYDLLPLNAAPQGTLSSDGPLAVTVTASGNPIVAEAINRVSFYYPVMDAASSANYFRRYAPGMLASLFNVGTAQFGPTTTQATTVPLPTTLGDVQVLVAGKAAPLLYVSSKQINFQIPSTTPLGLQEIDVVRVSTNEVLTSNFFQIQATSPGLFTSDASGKGQIAAINADDGTINSQSHPVKAGHYISLYGTGQGAVVGGPPDGTPPTGPVSTPNKPFVFINGPGQLPDADIQYSGLAPNFVGLWQINAKVPTDAPPGPVRVVVGMGGNFSNTVDTSSFLVTTIYVAQ